MGVTGFLQADMECTVGECSRLGLTPFQCALAALDEGRRDSFARHLRAEGLDVDFDPSPRVGKSLLREALRRGEDGAVQELLKRGASVHLDKTASKLSPTKRKRRDTMLSKHTSTTLAPICSCKNIAFMLPFQPGAGEQGYNDGGKRQGDGCPTADRREEGGDGSREKQEQDGAAEPHHSTVGRQSQQNGKEK